MTKSKNPSNDVAVLLMAYGAVATLDDIPAYLQDIRGGRPADAKLIENIRRRYERIGGKSPLLEITRAQAAALEQILNKKNKNSSQFKVFAGMRHSAPTIRDAVREIKSADCSIVAATPLNPYYSKMSIGAYMKKYEEALQLESFGIETVAIHSWGDHPGFIRVCANRLAQTLNRVQAKNQDEIAVVFSSHSLPQRILAENDPYPEQLKAAAAAVARRVGLNRWEFAYQSRGATADQWLGPDVAEVVDRLANHGCKTFILAPIGFISDHLETLYDDDVLYRERIEAAGMHFERVPSLNSDADFIEVLSQIITERLSGTIENNRERLRAGTR